MTTITMSKKNDIAKLIWCVNTLGESNYKFAEPMKLTFYNNFDRFLYKIVWGE